MKGKNPTVKQGKFMVSNGLDWEDWLIQKDTPSLMQIVHRETKEIKILEK
jgi:hypothetical protein